MDFTYTSEQEALRDSVRRFVEREYDWEARTRAIRLPNGTAPAHWPVFAELGWLGAGLSEEAGGFGGGAVENALIMEELGRALATEPFIAHVIATNLLSASDNPAAAELIAALVMGEKRAVPAIQEVAGRGDFRVVETRATPVQGGWTIDGAKALVEGGALADRLLVSARDADDVALFLVDPSASGVTRRDYRTVDNRHVADFTFDGVSLDADARLIAGNAGADAIERAVDHGIVALCGEALGAMNATMWATRDYLRTRKQFGVTIGSFQALQHRMADMLIEVELTRSILFQALAGLELDDADARRAAVSAAKVQVATGGVFVAGQAIQLHGGIGVTEELNVSHYYRRLYVIARQFGDAEMHLARFATATDRLALVEPA